MALTLQQISGILAHKNYEFGVYYSPNSFQESLNSLDKIKFLSVTRLKFEYSITDNLKPKKKGIYIFVLEGFGFPSIEFRYLLYIGRTQKGNSFKARFYKYRNSISDTSAVENVMLLTNLWPENTYVYFFELSNDKEIQDIEKILINRLKPSFNEEYFTTKTVESTPLYKLANP